MNEEEKKYDEAGEETRLPRQYTEAEKEILSEAARKLCEAGLSLGDLLDPRALLDVLMALNGSVSMDMDVRTKTITLCKRALLRKGGFLPQDVIESMAGK